MDVAPLTLPLYPQKWTTGLHNITISIICRGGDEPDLKRSRILHHSSILKATGDENLCIFEILYL